MVTAVGPTPITKAGVSDLDAVGSAGDGTAMGKEVAIGVPLDPVRTPFPNWILVREKGMGLHDYRVRVILLPGQIGHERLLQI